MKKISTLKGTALLFLLVFIVCGALYQAIGSYVAADGTLVEPFYLIGIGTFSFILAVIIFIISLLLDAKNSLRNLEKNSSIVLPEKKNHLGDSFSISFC